MTDARQVWECPEHGLLEQPDFLERLNLSEWEDDAPVCPRNLSDEVGHITDDLCHRTCRGPIRVVVVSWMERLS